MKKLALLTVSAALLTSAAQAATSQTIPDRGTVNVNGAKVFFKAEGQGEPLLMIHGYPLNGELFKKNRDLAGYRVVTVDLPGFGKSTLAPGQPVSIENYASTMLGFMDALGLQKTTAAGMSMGGMTLLQMYKSAPERFKSLILIDTTADPAGPAEAGMWRGVAQQTQERGVSSLVDVLMPRMMTGADRLNQPAQAGHLKTLIKQASRDGAVGGANALASRPDARPVLKSIRVPTLLLFGLEDNVTAVEGAQKMHQNIAGSQLVLIPGAGHAAIFEKAGAANAAIALWLGGNR